MHPIFAAVRRLLAYLLACVGLGAALAGLLRMTEQADAIGALAFAVPLAVLYGFIALSAYYLCRALPHAQRRAAAVVWRFGGAAVVAGLAWWAAGAAWNLVGACLPAGRPFVAMQPAGWVLFFIAGVVLYMVSLLAHDVLVAFERVREAARKEAELRVLARDAELRMLRTQIDPHFLFNSLNSISALTAIDPAEAREMTVDLAQFFRRTLALAEREHIALADEVALCRHFLAIERRRFGAKLGHELRIDPAAERCLLPPMTLQPLLENAIKHGLRGLDAGGVIEVDAVVRDGWLHVAVANPVAADAAAPRLAAQGAHGLGLGLANIRQRLAVLHGDRARLDVRREPGRFSVEITLPAHLETSP
ncbi:MAG: histidine kinase [Burkholderiaceae bacterium]